MSDVVDLNSRKKEKRYKKIIQDIDSILKIISLTQRSLSFFKEYVPAQEIISILETNKTMLEIHRKKYEAELQANKKENT